MVATGPIGRLTDVRADHANGSLLTYTDRSVTHLPCSASDGCWPTVTVELKRPKAASGK